MPAEQRPEQEHPVLSRAQAAELIGVSVSTIDRLRKDGLPSSRLRGRVVIATSELLEYVRRHGTDTMTALATVVAVVMVLEILCALALMPHSLCEFLHDVRHR